MYDKVKKLSSVQARVYSQMEAGRWLSAYEIKASLATLNALFERGLLKRRGVGSLGYGFSPRTTAEYFKPPTIA